jgi:hypothetical protein
MGWGMAAMEYCEVGVPFIGPGRRGGGRPVVMAAVVRFQLAAGYGGEAKRRRRRLWEGKGGGDREASGPMRRGWPEGMGGARRRSVARRWRVQLLGEEEGEGGFWFFTFPEARDVNLKGANAEVACWAGWAEKGGRRWAAAGLKMKRGGRAETISWAEIK